MPSYDSIFNAFVTVLVTIDPPGLAPLFLALTRGMNREERTQVSIRASVIAFGVMALFAVAGVAILGVFGITLPAFRVAGALLLFYIAFEMVFERRQDRKEKSADVAVTKDMIHDIAAFPLAIPLIAGPGAISATVLLSGSFQGVTAKACWSSSSWSASPSPSLSSCSPSGSTVSSAKLAARFSPGCSASFWRHSPCNSSRTGSGRWLRHDTGKRYGPH